MHLSNAAALLLLGTLQPALGKPALLPRVRDGSSNEVLSQWLTATETVINYLAPEPDCPNSKPQVGVCLVEECNSPGAAADLIRARQPVERTSGFPARTAKFNNTELGPGEYRAAFVCEDGKGRRPWMVSKKFTVDAPPTAEEGQCVHRVSVWSPAWQSTACDKVPSRLCDDCDFSGRCSACLDCQDQCGL